jgi:hypothetical protein
MCLTVFQISSFHCWCSICTIGSRFLLIFSRFICCRVSVLHLLFLSFLLHHHSLTYRSMCELMASVFENMILERVTSTFICVRRWVDSTSWLLESLCLSPSGVFHYMSLLFTSQERERSWWRREWTSRSRKVQGARGGMYVLLYGCVHWSSLFVVSEFLCLLSLHICEVNFLRARSHWRYSTPHFV